ncbi:PIN domain nuclease [Candidatus Marsarchaeota G2 archaeon OSP_D]|jgi:predicted nucleic acid-binding protein|uniref:PIN domain nuclease n=7 Tax=Candidatus Marsarchaeota group 2 TaxID=2203771 RepID=A0A2R6CDE2_9ARCH|nr:MAG: PIN domain nuclease [Candidatus Marsarchaeota G2 archaeon ECH_B_SAG-M15]PSN90962.1 MAG: PIN domain nuclease [Candidatus Marsarchaeota G2 archaeon OSP_D]PSN96099.1 MAG: PIN domain nuclease [Candidatus Marsarchaeota G2 archaeon ECH_B_2]PSN97011.1 MAG: PIN domain nuclease [Candidatus Marsarchaeota G2 archaeon ECH_B_SAG-C16]PSO00206.1 MAG: PIN domain nuclease [Candidatus Marsarchaeota G2 archaeon ECH_B_3]PSO02701.1 MAG: PIN domain nuclease [Candidatus Marsarchaeota G2 archaeon ECH_B_1]PSO
MRDSYLLDSSAIYPLLDYLEATDTEKIHILRLTLYEIGNIIWKEHYLFKRIKDAEKTCILFHKFLSSLRILEDPPMNESMKIAVNRGLSFYDACYIAASEKHGLTLVSNDSKILKNSSAISFNDFRERTR